METNIVTVIFEADSLDQDMIDDVLSELDRWFIHDRALGIVCEVHWSVPEMGRDRRLETRLKDGLHLALRANSHRMPLWCDPVTEEESLVDVQLGCYQGVYRRYYKTLLNCQHQETGQWHAPYWQLSEQLKPSPDPAHFLFGADRQRLSVASLVAVNIICLVL